MAETYDTYGFKSRDIEGVATDLGLALGILFRSRKDDILGRYYQAGKLTEENFDLLCNQDEYQDHIWLEPAFREYRSILYVNRTRRSAEIEALILKRMGKGRFALLRRKTYERLK